jgi:hypothetical protein
MKTTAFTGNPPYSIPSYWSSLQGGEWLTRGDQHTAAAPYPVGLLRAGIESGLDLVERLCGEVRCGSGRDAGWGRRA